MSASPNLLSRIGRWFRGSPADPAAPLDPASEDGGDANLAHVSRHGSHAIERVDTTRSTFLRPWAKRDAAIDALHHSFESLSDLMHGIKENLDRQGQRTEELTRHLAKLPEALQGLPEHQRVQSETLLMIGGQMEQQAAQQSRLADILSKVSDHHAGQRTILESLDQRVDGLRGHDEAISENLRSVGSAMENVSRTSASSADVLQHLNENITSRDAELERILHRQNTRFTTMLAVAIFLSVAALAAVVVIGYVMISRGH